MLKGGEKQTHPISQQIRQEATAQLLPEARHTVLRPRVHLKVETFCGNDVLDELLALGLDVLRDSRPEVWVSNEGMCCMDMLVADILHRTLDSLYEIVLQGFVADCRSYVSQLLE